MNSYSGSGGPGVKYTEDFSITIAAGTSQQTLVLGQAVNFDKSRLYWMGHRESSTNNRAVTLEFSGTQNIIAKRTDTTGDTIVNGLLVEFY